METEHIVTRPVFAEPSELGRFLDALGVDPDEAAEVTDADGSIVLAIGDRGFTVERNEAIDCVTITIFVCHLAGLDVTTVLQDLMMLNARPNDTGGLVFGLAGQDVIVARLTLPETDAYPDTLADAVRAVIDSTDLWRGVVESAVETLEANRAEPDGMTPEHAPGRLPNDRFA